MRHGPTIRVAVAALFVLTVVASCQADDDDLAVTDPIDRPDGPASDSTVPDGSADRSTVNSDEPAEPADVSNDPPISLPTASDLVAPTTAERRPEPAGSPTGFAETVYERGLIDRGLTPFTDQAAADLASRLGVEQDAIEVLTAVLVVWPDASIGCPEPGLNYAQVVTDGSVIELGLDGRVYRYHSGGSRQPTLCDRPLEQPPEPTAIN